MKTTFVMIAFLLLLFSCEKDENKLTGPKGAIKEITLIYKSGTQVSYVFNYKDEKLVSIMSNEKPNANGLKFKYDGNRLIQYEMIGFVIKYANIKYEGERVTKICIDSVGSLTDMDLSPVIINNEYFNYIYDDSSRVIDIQYINEQDLWQTNTLLSYDSSSEVYRIYYTAIAQRQQLNDTIIDELEVLHHDSKENPLNQINERLGIFMGFSGSLSYIHYNPSVVLSGLDTINIEYIYNSQGLPIERHVLEGEWSDYIIEYF